MRLIGLAVVLTLSLILAPLATEAQQAAKSARTAYLLRDNDDPAASSNPREVFLQGLSDLGYVEGRNLVIEYRSAEGTTAPYARNFG